MLTLGGVLFFMDFNIRDNNNDLLGNSNSNSNSNLVLLNHPSECSRKNSHSHYLEDEYSLLYKFLPKARAVRFDKGEEG